MLRIWAKTTIDLKITSSYIYESIDNFSPENFRFHLEKICHHLDIPTPILLPVHIKNYDEFGIIQFSPSDFVESVNFDKLILENAIITH